MSPALPAAFLGRPIAHRGLHGSGLPENSRAAVMAAVAAGYGIEIDLQLSRDGVPLVFHDADLFRLTGRRGLIRDLDAAEAGAISLAGGGAEPIPTLAGILGLVRGRVPLLIELKDQSGTLAPGDGRMERAVVAALEGYSGPCAVMSFNPHSIARIRDLAPDLPRGLVTCAFRARNWPLPAERRAWLRAIGDFEPVGAGFISHDARDLRRGRVQELRRRGVPVLCWTIRSEAAEFRARRLADNITFEGYRPRLPGLNQGRPGPDEDTE
ncbi:glycerophosphodiester phosphodiesterase family protein [Pontibaca methylaminivorans]|uniref:glycerophosphodiester phosphodiesterase family protein n=1 Tax=Pontibaca methylaminivorans TaxID=515897 RepID=UPI002FDA6631